MADFWARVRHPDGVKYVLARLEIDGEDYSLKDGHIMDHEMAKKKPENAFDADTFKAQLEKHGFDENEVGIQIEEALEDRERESVL